MMTEEVHTLTLGAKLSIDVVRKNIKNIHLSVYPPTGRVRMAVPLTVDDESVRLFAISKLSWIRRHQRNFAVQERQSPRQYVERESHYFLGKRYLLRVFEHNHPPKVELKTKKYLDVYVRPDTSTEQRQIILQEWYRTELKKQIAPLLSQWETRIGVSVNDWSVKQMKTKWGACNIEARRVWFNLELAKKPLPCLEYIVVHELIHLLERHHNVVFLSYMDKFLPNWKQLKRELNALPVSHADFGSARKVML
jgi:hypothetical protein